MDASPAAEERRKTQRFEALLARTEQVRVRGLRFDELRELGELYRYHTARLAAQRDRRDDPDALRTLNALCVRAYTILYGRSSNRARRDWRAELRDALGRTWRVQVAAWALLFAGMLIGGALAWRDPEALPAFVPETLGYSAGSLDRLESSPAARAEFLAAKDMEAAHKVLFGSFLFSNNTRVGLLAFATGMLAGIPTVLLQLYNGIMLGAFASIFLRDPNPLPFLAWILPHGVPELTAISLCAAGGLQLGAAVAAPGRAGRAAALRAAMPSALMLVATALPLFVVAALIESFVRQSQWGIAPRLGIAALCLLATLAALALARRYAGDERVDTRWLRELAAG
jgi:uncharacterized membrane protein SpoIIM required for sporulation